MVERAAGDRRACSPGPRARRRASGSACRRAHAMGKLERSRARRLRRHGLVSRARQAQLARRRSRRRRFRWGRSTTWTSCGSTASRWPAATVKTARVYDVPARTLQAGDNLVVVNVFDMWGSGGLHGPAAQRALRFADGSTVPLDGWEYQLPPQGLSSMPRAPWEPNAGISILYNGMIAPLGKFGLRGVAWYQGEANAGLGDAQALPGATRGAVHGLAPAIRISAAVPRGAARQLECARDGARQQRLGETARCATPRGGRRRQRRARGDHRHRQSRRHPPDQQAGRRQAPGACRAPRGVRRKDLGLGRAADVGAANYCGRRGDARGVRRPAAW